MKSAPRDSGLAVVVSLFAITMTVIGIAPHPKDSISQNRRIFAVLREPVNITPKEESVIDALDRLARQHNLRIVYDKQMLAAAGISLGENGPDPSPLLNHINGTWSGWRLESTLHSILNCGYVTTGLTFVVQQDESLLVTTDVAATKMRQPMKLLSSLRNSSDFPSIVRDSTNVSFQNTPLIDAVDSLQRQHGVKIKLDESALAEDGLKVSMPISLVVSGPGLGNTIELMNEELAYTVQPDNSLLITTEIAACESYRSVRFPIHDFASSLDAVNDLVSLIRYETGAIWRDELSSNSDGGGTIRFDQASQSLIINQCEWDLENIRVLLNRLRRPLRPGDSFADLAETDLDRRIYKALEATSNISFEGVSLGSAIAAISHQHRIPILIDKRAFEDEGIVAEECTVSVHLSDISLRSAIRLMLDSSDSGLALVHRNEVLWITTEIAAYESFEIYAYSVSDVLKSKHPDQSQWHPDGGWGGRTLSHDEILRLVREIPDLWVNNGVNGGSASWFWPNGSVVVRHTAAVHEQIQQLVANIRKPILPDKPIDLFGSTGLWRQQETHLRSRLNRRVNQNFNNTQLGVVLDLLSDQHDVTLLPDRECFRATGYRNASPPPDYSGARQTRVMLTRPNLASEHSVVGDRADDSAVVSNVDGRVSGMTLDEALDALLNPVELTHRIEDQVIKILPGPAIRWRLHSLIGIDVVNARNPQVEARWQPTEARGYGVLQSLLDERFGYGTLDEFRWPPYSVDNPTVWGCGTLNCLVVCNTESAQKEISEFLSCLRERRSRSIVKPKANLPQASRCVRGCDPRVCCHNQFGIKRARAAFTWNVYPLPETYRNVGSASSLADMIQQQVCSSSWSAFEVGGPIIINDCVVVIQSLKVHRALRAWFAALPDIPAE